ncbi:MAG: alpha/beta fold hydrolase [Gammaproteobacteria bacterium]|nr:alpha/beta fold hydrolase [Gammaproteobacteria bacterium]
MSDAVKFQDTKQQITGPAGELELVYRRVPNDRAPVAVICHPHPLHGGTLQNKVVHMLASGLNELGVHTVRFNFRGVGGSQGEFDSGIGESEDLLAVKKWVEAALPGSPVWLAGFSFGAYVAYRSFTEFAAERLILVAPPVTMFEFTEIPEPDVPWIVIQGTDDEIIAAEAVSAWVEQRQHAPEYFLHEETGHFFHGRLNLLKESLKVAIEPQS